MAQFLSAATQSKIELRRDRVISLATEHVISATPVALAAIQGAFRCVEVVGAPVDGKVVESLLRQSESNINNSSNSDNNNNNGRNPGALHAGAGTPSVAWCGEQDGSVTLRQLTTGALEQRFPATARGVFPSSLINVCGLEVWVGYSDGSMRIFSPFRKTALVEFRAHSTTVSSMLFVSLGVAHNGAQFVISASTDWTIVVWDALRDFSGQAPHAVSRVAVAKSPIRAIASATYCADEDPLGGGGAGGNADTESHTLVAVGCGNGAVLMLELDPRSTTIKMMWESPSQQHSVNAVTFIKTFGSKNVRIVDNIVNPGSSNDSNNRARQQKRGVATNALIVAYCSNNGAVLAREALSGTALFVIEKRPSAVLSLSADMSSGLLWVGGSDGIITVYNCTVIVKPQPQTGNGADATTTAANNNAHFFFPHVTTLQHHGGAYVSAVKCFTGNSSQRRLWACSSTGEMQCFLLASSSLSVADIMGSAAPAELEFLREKILRDGAELHHLRTAAWRLRQREQLCIDQFTAKNNRVSAFIGGPGWELATVGLQHIALFRLKQRRYMIAQQRASFSGFRAAIHLARRYMLKWSYYSAANRYRASGMLVATMFKNVHRFDVQARYLSRLWRETLRIEREAQLRNVSSALASSISSGQLRLAYRRWLQWLTSRRSFRSARKICNIIGKSTDNAILVTYWNALVYATQHREKLDRFGGAIDGIARLTTTALMREYFRKWKQLRRHNAQVGAFTKSIDTRGQSLAREVLARYFRRWSEYFQQMELARVEAEMAKRKKERLEWEAMIVCDRAAMRRELDERKPRLLQQLAEERAKLAAMEAELDGQEERNASIQRETLFVNEDLPIDPNAPTQEQVACVIEFLKARAIHCYHDIRLVSDLNKKALASLTPPPRLPGGPAPVTPQIDQPFGMALLYAKQVFSSYIKEKGLLAMRLPAVKEYVPTISAEEAKKMADQADKAAKAAAKAAANKSAAAKPPAKPAAGKKSSPVAAGIANAVATVTAGKAPVPKPRPPPEPDQYRTYWGLPLEMLDDASRRVTDEMVLAAKQLIVCYDTMQSRGLLAQRQATGAAKAAMAHINPAAAGAYHCRTVWLNEFLVNAHLFLRISIDEYRKRLKQGIETGGIDDIDNARAQTAATAAAAPGGKKSPVSTAAAAAALSSSSSGATRRPTTPAASTAKKAAVPAPTSVARKAAPTPKPAAAPPAVAAAPRPKIGVVTPRPRR